MKPQYGTPRLRLTVDHEHFEKTPHAQELIMKAQKDLAALRIDRIVRLDAAYSPALQRRVNTALADCMRDVELDLSETVFIDSSGLGALMTLRNKLDRHGCAVRLLDPSPPAWRILELTRLHRVLQIVNTGRLGPVEREVTFAG